MRSVIALRTILDSKTVRCISSLGSLARLYSCVWGWKKKRYSACASGRSGGPRANNIYKISISLFVFFFFIIFVIVLPRNPPLLLSLSRGTGTSASGITDHGDSHARTFPCTQVDTRHSYTNGYTPDYDRHSCFRTY